MLIGRSFHHLTLAVTALFFFLSSITLSYSSQSIALSLAVFVGTLFIYRLSVWVPVLSWSRRFIDFYFKPSVIELSSFLLVLLSTFYFLKISEIVVLISWGLFSTCYFLNIKLDEFHFKGLRSIPLIKTIHLSLLWTIMGFIFKLPELTSNYSLMCDFIIRFVIIFLICLGVDLRDIAKDEQSSTTTLATHFGFSKLKQLMIFFNSVLICLLLLFPSYSTIELFIASLLLIEIIILKINSRPNTFTLLMDGTLMCYSFLVFIAQHKSF